MHQKISAPEVQSNSKLGKTLVSSLYGVQTSYHQVQALFLLLQVYDLSTFYSLIIAEHLPYDLGRNFLLPFKGLITLFPFFFFF